MSTTSKLELEIGQLADLPRPHLVECWIKIYRRPPPKSIKRGLLERAIAWHLQAKQFGGLSPATKRQLEVAAVSLMHNAEAAQASGMDSSATLGSAACDDTGAIVQPRRPTPASTSLAPGTRLIRAWHGTSHAVDVIEEGFVFEGKTYGSLSAIAREITGARWSGPRFFGL